MEESSFNQAVQYLKTQDVVDTTEKKEVMIELKNLVQNEIMFYTTQLQQEVFFVKTQNRQARHRLLHLFDRSVYKENLNKAKQYRMNNSFFTYVVSLLQEDLNIRNSNEKSLVQHRYTLISKAKSIKSFEILVMDISKQINLLANVEELLNKQSETSFSLTTMTDAELHEFYVRYVQ